MDIENFLQSDTLVRPSKAAQMLGCSISSFWERAKKDPDFPRRIYALNGMAYLIEREVHAYRLKRLGAEPGRLARVKSNPQERMERARAGKKKLAIWKTESVELDEPVVDVGVVLDEAGIR